MSRNWVSTLASVLTLAIGIGATTAIFSLIYGVLWRPLPYPDSESIVVVARAFTTEKADAETSSIKYRIIRENQRSLASVAAVLGGQRVTALLGNEPESIVQRPVSAGFFDVLSAPLPLGRSFLSNEDQPGQTGSAVLGYAFWQRRFGGSPQALGQALRLDGVTYTVVGVAPAKMDSYFASDVFTTFDVVGHPLGGGDNLLVIGRLAGGRSLEQAQADMALVGEAIRREHPTRTAKDEVLEVRRLRHELTAEARSGLWVLMAAVSLVLLIACANVANLLMATIAARSGEMAIRSAMGADRGRLLRQLLTECLCLALAGGLLGVLLAQAMIRLVVDLQLADLPRLGEVAVDGRILLFALLLALATTLFFGLVPAAGIGKLDIQTALREGAGRSGRGRERFGQVVLIAELALCTMLLIASSLLFQSLVRLWRTDPGFEVSELTTFQVALAGPRYEQGPVVASFAEALNRDLAALPRVKSTAACFCQPLGRSLRLPVHSVDGRAKPADRYLGQAYWMPVSASFFGTMGIPLRSGRDFDGGEGSGSLPVAIVNQAFADRFFGEGAAGQVIGKRLLLGWDMLGPEYVEDWREIVGVVADIHESGVKSEKHPAVFVPLGQMSAPVTGIAEKLPAQFLLRTDSDQVIDRGSLQAAVVRQDPGLPVERVLTMRDIASASVHEESFQTTLLGAFALTGLVLVMVGVYGVVSFSVARRTREIGIRMAVGASPQAVVRWILGRALRWAAWGVALGVPAALLLVRVLESVLFGFTVGDWWIFLTAPVLLALLTLLASYLPARSAASTNVTEALGLQ